MYTIEQARPVLDGLTSESTERFLDETVEGQPVKLVLRSFYAENPFGRHMAEQEPLRFSLHAYDQAQMHADLGANLNPARHQLEVARAVSLGLDLQQRHTGKLPIPLSETGKLVLTAGLHDIDESQHPQVNQNLGFTVGDIPFGLKTAQNLQDLAAIRSYVWHYAFPGLSESMFDYFDRLVAHAEPDSAAHRLLKLSHAIVELETGLRAGELFFETLSRNYSVVRPRRRPRVPDATLPAPQTCRIARRGSWQNLGRCPKRSWLFRACRCLSRGTRHTTRQSCSRVRVAETTLCKHKRGCIIKSSHVRTGLFKLFASRTYIQASTLRSLRAF